MKLTKWPTFDDLMVQESPLKGKRVLVRVDFNVPILEGKVRDKRRLLLAVPTVQALVAQGACVLLLSHLGNPKHPDKSYSLEPLAPVFAALLGQNVTFNETHACLPGSVTLLENTRFYAGEIQNDPQCAQMLAALGDIFIFDAFSVAHRAHASTCGIMAYLPTYFGPGFAQEWEGLGAQAFERPAFAAVGGSKVSTKLALLHHLIETMDGVIVGGGIANTFLAAQGYEVGHSFYEPMLCEETCQLMARAQESGCALVLPTDVIVERAGGRCRTDAHRMQEADMALDIGPQTLSHITRCLEGVKTLVWNGPLGAFETAGFDHGTVAFAQLVADLTAHGQLYSIAGGGDTLHALEREGLSESFSYISTAGGAFLAYLAGETLPVLKRYLERT